MKSCFYNSNRSLNSNYARLHFSQIGKRRDETDGAMSAHAEVADIVEEDDAELTGRVGGRDEVRADEHVRAAGFEQDGAAQVVVMRFQRG